MVAVYDEPSLRAALDGALHPGGPALTDEMLAACSLPHGAFVADVGCGAGLTAARLRGQGLAAVGIDLSAALLRDARERAPDLGLLRAEAQRLPFANGVLDAVLSECALSTFSDLDAALAESAPRPKAGRVAAGVRSLQPQPGSRPRWTMRRAAGARPDD